MTEVSQSRKGKKKREWKRKGRRKERKRGREGRINRYLKEIRRNDLEPVHCLTFYFCKKLLLQSFNIKQRDVFIPQTFSSFLLQDSLSLLQFDEPGQKVKLQIR